MVHHRPETCSDCAAQLSGHDPQPKRHQVTDIPPVKPIVTEQQIHTLQCPDCGYRCGGQLPQQTCTQTDPAKLIAQCTVTTAENYTDTGLKSSHHLSNRCNLWSKFESLVLTTDHADCTDARSSM
ncbi:MAG: IS66 family transposase zinc-finger binding domain-containing protein [Planctomycetaceae bacterium]